MLEWKVKRREKMKCENQKVGKKYIKIEKRKQ